MRHIQFKKSPIWKIFSNIINFIDKHEGLFLALFTAFLAIATFRLWKSTAKMEYSANRPWVGISSVTTEPESPIADQDFLIKATLRNSGHSPALDWKAYFFWPEIMPTKKFNNEHEDTGELSTGVLMPDSTFTIDIRVYAANLSLEQIKKLKSKEDTIFIMGRTEYKDSDGKKHFTTICMFYNVATKRFGNWTIGNDAT